MKYFFVHRLLLRTSRCWQIFVIEFNRKNSFKVFGGGARKMKFGLVHAVFAWAKYLKNDENANFPIGEKQLSNMVDCPIIPCNIKQFFWTDG